mgnify:CR=1 FL=1
MGSKSTGPTSSGLVFASAAVERLIDGLAGLVKMETHQVLEAVRVERVTFKVQEHVTRSGSRQARKAFSFLQRQEFIAVAACLSLVRLQAGLRTEPLQHRG